jgi:hypothetical protein
MQSSSDRPRDEMQDGRAELRPVNLGANDLRNGPHAGQVLRLKPWFLSAGSDIHKLDRPAEDGA